MGVYIIMWVWPYPESPAVLPHEELHDHAIAIRRGGVHGFLAVGLVPLCHLEPQPITMLAQTSKQQGLLEIMEIEDKRTSLA